MDEPAGVSAGDNPHTLLDGQLYALNVNVHQRLGAYLDMRRADRAVEVVHLKGGREKGSLVRHHLEQIRVGSQVAAVFNGAGAGFDGHGQARPAHGVAQRPAPQRGGLGHQGLGLVQGIRLVQRAVAGAAGGAAGGGELYLVGAAAHQLPHLGAHAFHPVGHAVGGQRVVAQQRLAVSAAADLVLNAAGGGHNVDGDNQTGAFD